MGKKNIGYLLPAVRDAGSFGCIRVYYPKSDEYLRALLGSLSYLSTWRAWERTSDKGGKVAAEQWKDALDLTIDDMALGCGCEGEMNEQEFREIIIEELENMTINVVQTVNGCCRCGGGCGCGGSSVVTTDEVPPDGYDVDPVEVVEPVEIVDEQDMCIRGGYLLIQYRNACLSAVQGIEGGYDSAVEWFNRALEWVLSPVPLAYEVYLRLKSWSALGTFTNTELFLDVFDPNFSAMACAVARSESAADAKEAVRSILEDYVWSNVPVYVSLMYKEIFELIPWGEVLSADNDADIPPAYQNRTCCDGIPVPDGTELLPEIPSGYEYVPTTYLSYDSGLEPSDVIGDGNQAVITWKNEAENPWGVGVQVDYDVTVPELEGKEHVGIIVLVESNQLTEGRHIDIQAMKAWGNQLSGSNDHGDIPLTEGGDLYYISLYAFGVIADDLGAIMGELGDRNNTGYFFDGAFTTYGNMYTSQNDDVSGVLTVRSWHIVRDAV